MGKSAEQFKCPRASALSEVDLTRKVEREVYADVLDEKIRDAQRIQTAYFLQRHRAVIVFEGWDAAGKGGAIRRLTARMDPRGYNVFPIAAPTEEERTKHHLYRFWNKVPGPGELHIFDRSWYGRVLVERVEGFASKVAWQRGFDELNQFEKQLHDDGVRVIKVFLHISRHEQKKRFEARLNDPMKQWKITAEDFRNREKWSLYEEAISEMLQRTSTDYAPWQVISGEDKKTARLDILTYVLDQLGEGVNLDFPKLNKVLLDEARSLGFELSE